MTNIKKTFAYTAVLLFQIYILWYTEAYDTVNIFLYGGAVLVVIATVFCTLREGKFSIYIPSYLKWWVAYGVYSLLTGILVATDRSVMFSSIVTYIAFLTICICISVIMHRQSDEKWLMKQIIFVCLICSIYTIFSGFDYYNGVMVITMGPHNNPNTLGVLMVFGVFSVMYISHAKLSSLVKAIPLVLLFFYIIILTGSKKSLLAVALFTIISVVGIISALKKEEKIGSRIIVLLLLCAVGFYAYTYFANEFMSTSSFARLQRMFDSGGTGQRSYMYHEAFEMFKNNPIFGQGYGQFRVLSTTRLYSHSTYAELISGSGLIGTVLFMFPILKSGYVLAKSVLYKKDLQSCSLLGFYIIELFLGTVNIFFYEFSHLLMWTIFFYAVEKAAMHERDISALSFGGRQYVKN